MNEPTLVKVTWVVTLSLVKLATAYFLILCKSANLSSLFDFQYLEEGVLLITRDYGELPQF